MKSSVLSAAIACVLIVHPAQAQTRSAQSLPSQSASQAAAAQLDAREESRARKCLAEEVAGALQSSAREEEWVKKCAAGHSFDELYLALPAFGILGILLILINGNGGPPPPKSPG